MVNINYFEKQVSDIIKELRQYGFAWTLNKNVAKEVQKQSDLNILVRDRNGDIFITVQEEE